MQYPIIDLITSAYLNNGWTGLDISTGKNLVDSSHANSGLLSVTVGDSINTIIPSTRYSYSDPVNCINGVAIYAKSNNISQFNGLYINCYNDDILVYTRNLRLEETTVINYIIPANTYEKVCLIYGAPAGVIIGTDIPGEIQIENGNVITPYEPYNPNPSNDFPNRLKLPLPHYFPNPVIDALQRAAAGTQTADDTEILRHYLTPLGIGGI